MKFNPYHDRLGRFTSGGGFGVSSSMHAGDKDRQAVTFSANPKTKAGRNAIDRQGGVTAAAFGRTKVEYQEANVSDFTKTVTGAKSNVPEKDRWRVTAYSESEFNEWHSTAKCYTTKRGSTFAIDNGDIISVCRSGKDYATGKQLMEEAIKKGGTKLDSYEKNDAFYRKCGFEPVSWCKWNDAYAPDDWVTANGYTPGKWGKMVASGESAKIVNLKVPREDIVFYKHSKNPSKESLESFKKRVKGYGPDDYDKAYDARDNAM